MSDTLSDNRNAPDGGDEAPIEPQDDSTSRWYLRFLFRPSDQTAIVFLVVITAALLLGWVARQWYRCGGVIDVDRVDPPAVAFRVDINEAQWPELTVLPGIGEVTARKIIAFRDEHGTITSLNQLVEINGISETMVRRLDAWVLPFDGSSAESESDLVHSVPKDDPPRSGRSVMEPEVIGTAENEAIPATADIETDTRIDINHATLGQLDLLPGIGPTLAGRIIESRESQGPFISVDDLMRVRGIGDKILEQLLPLIKVGSIIPSKPIESSLD